MLGKIEGRSRQQRKRCLYVIIDSVDSSLRKLWDMVKDREPSTLSSLATAKSQTRLGDGTTSKGGELGKVQN